MNSVSTCPPTSMVWLRVKQQIRGELIQVNQPDHFFSLIVKVILEDIPYAFYFFIQR